jgi:integrase
LIGDFPLEVYTSQMVEKFKILRLKKVSPVKVNIEFRTLRSAFNIAINWGLISENPFKRCKQIRVPQKRPVYLTQDEFHQLMSAIDLEWFNDVVRFAIATMMRAGEIVNLEWDSVDFDRRLIRVENTDQFRIKTHKSRAIPMDEMVFLMLKEIKRTCNKVFVFPDGRPVSVGYISSRFKKFARKAGLRNEIHFHSLRHTGATWLVQRDVPIYTVQQLLGHSRVDMTQIYSHLEIEHLRKPQGKIVELLDSD